MNYGQELIYHHWTVRQGVSQVGDNIYAHYHLMGVDLRPKRIMPTDNFHERDGPEGEEWGWFPRGGVY